MPRITDDGPGCDRCGVVRLVTSRDQTPVPLRGIVASHGWNLVCWPCMRELGASLDDAGLERLAAELRSAPDAQVEPERPAAGPVSALCWED